MVDSGKLTCGKCRSERLRLLEEKLQNALFQIDDLRSMKWALVEQLRLATAGREVGRRDTVPGDREGRVGLVMGESIIWNVEQCFQI